MCIRDRLVDVHGFVVFVGLGKPEILAGDEGGDAVVGDVYKRQVSTLRKSEYLTKHGK